MKTISFLFTMYLLSQFFYGQAQTKIDTINALNNKLQLEKLKEKTVKYIVYSTDSLFNLRSSGDIWERKTQFDVMDSRPVINFTWKWYKKDTLVAIVTNTCDKQTLSPLLHKANYFKRGIHAHYFTPTSVIPIDSVKNNLAIQTGTVTLDIPVISWEQDLETYPLLPLKKVGQVFDVSFYDPNGKKPSYHRYEIVGKEFLTLNGSTKVKCWILQTSYGALGYAKFWITTKGNEVIKMQEYFRGNYRFKVRLY